VASTWVLALHEGEGRTKNFPWSVLQPADASTPHPPPQSSAFRTFRTRVPSRRCGCEAHGYNAEGTIDLAALCGMWRLAAAFLLQCLAVAIPRMSSREQFFHERPLAFDVCLAVAGIFCRQHLF
jgi:hypothetical protein